MFHRSDLQSVFKTIKQTQNGEKVVRVGLPENGAKKSKNELESL